MPRANRTRAPGYVWHITHRCHRKDFLLRFARDRDRWVRWLQIARKRHGICVLNYIVTCNHIHLLIEDVGGETTARAMQLVAGRIAQEYNRRKKRVGAFWQDRYHATAVQSDHHLVRCLTYIDLNMVRAGVVSHPAEWRHSGYAELISSRRRNHVVARDRLMQLLNASAVEDLVELRDAWLELMELERDPKWTESLAVGSEAFVDDFLDRLPPGQRGPEVVADRVSGSFVVRESSAGYGYHAWE